MQEKDLKKYSYIIIGGGLSGISLFKELKERSKSVALIDCSLSEKAETQNNIDQHQGSLKIKKESQVIGMGGGTKSWGGLMANFDDSDFKSWPINKNELDKYLYRLSSKYDVAGTQDIKNFFRIKKKYKFDEIVFKPFLAKQPAYDFSKALNNTDLKDIYRGLKLEEICFTNEKIVSELIFFEGKEKKTCVIDKQAKVILCLNSIETSRVLLNSKDFQKHFSDLPVGKYLSNHPKGILGSVLTVSEDYDDQLFWGLKIGDMAGFLGLKLKCEILTDTPNHYVRIEPLYSWSDNLILKNIIKISELAQVVKLFGEKKIVLRSIYEAGEYEKVKSNNSFSSTIFGIVDYILHRFLGFKPKLKGIRLRLVLDIPPDRTNKIMLSDRTNENGYKLANVNLNITDEVVDSVELFYNHLSIWFKKNNIGELRYEKNIRTALENFIDSSHHMGATRIGIDPKESVVDTSQKVHYAKNLYINGASVIPYSGHSNPGLTILAMSERLADII